MTWLDRLFRSPWFWMSRAVTAAVSLFLIWRVTIMATETILYTPAEYLPVLLILGLIIPGLLTLLKGRTKYNDWCKEKLRSGEISKAPAYGMDYLAAHLGTVALGVVGSILIPGVVCDALGIECSYSLALVIVLIWTVFVGVKGAETMSDVVDLFRDKAKIADLSKKKTE